MKLAVSVWEQPFFLHRFVDAVYFIYDLSSKTVYAL